MTLDISHLSFAYSKTSRQVLNDISFSVGEGDLLAVSVKVQCFAVSSDFSAVIRVSFI